MNIVIHQELLNLNLDILAKTGIKKSTVNKLHKLKAKKLCDLANLEFTQLEQLLKEDTELNIEQLSKLCSLDLKEFTFSVFDSLKNDPVYEIILLHINNHTHQEIAQKFGISKEKVKQKLNEFLQSLFTLVDAIGNKLIANKPYIGIEELEEILPEEDKYKLLVLAFRTHNTKWLYHNEAECFTKTK